MQTPTLYPHQSGNKSDAELMMCGYGLTLAKFYYRMPDFRSVLNEHIWNKLDLAPDFPRLFAHIEFWQKNIEGPLHSVSFTHRKKIEYGDWQNVVYEIKYH